VDPLAALSRNIKALRKQAALTQQEVAEAAGLDYAQYRKIENGQTNASVRTLARVAAALGLEDLSSMFVGVAASDR
jgi:transcriptional regulator with XRE-family HTH domain